MSGSQGSVVVIDAMSFRRARDESFLAPWAKEEKLDLISVMPTEVHGALGENINCRMLIYDIGGVSASSHEILLDIHVLRTLFPAAAVVIFSDNEGFDSIIAALNAGARGYLGNSMPPDLALQALSFLLRGGTYFPPAAIMASRPSGKSGISGYRRSTSEETAADGDLEQSNRIASSVVESSASQQQAAISYEKLAQVTPGCQQHFESSSEDLIETPGSNNEIKAAFSHPLMSDRQRAVLLCLCQGDPNKVIGRKLGMTETTVKVHVREIMRKLGVVNRTQVAIAVGRNGLLVGNGDVLLAGQDAPALLPPRQPNC
jgi:DNA-binding NarL/FixJ family response regulator